MFKAFITCRVWKKAAGCKLKCHRNRVEILTQQAGFHKTVSPHTRFSKSYGHLSKVQTYVARLHTVSAVSVSECVQEMTQLLEAAKVPEAKCSAEYIVAFCLGHKTLCGVRRDAEISHTRHAKITELVQRRASRVPLQYVLGEWDFRHLTLQCSPPVFIPRPETEELVSQVLADPVTQKAKSFIEVGPGTGAISVSLLSELPQIHATAVEISPEACDLTRTNARLYSVSDRLNVINSHFGTDISFLRGMGPFDFLISNPPYIPTADLEVLHPEVKHFEDQAALDGGTDGLDVIRYIIQHASSLVRADGLVWLEVDTTHPPLINNLVTTCPQHRIQFVGNYHDLYHRPRFVQLRVRKAST